MESHFKESTLTITRATNRLLVPLLLLIAALLPEPAFCTVHERCPYTSNGARLMSTSGCAVGPDSVDSGVSGSGSDATLLTLDVILNVPRHTREHVQGQVDEFLWNVRAFRESVRTEYREWSLEYTDLPGRTYDLTPHERNTSLLTNSRALNRHLRQLRWWMTAIESGFQLVHSTGQLGVRTGYVMACKAARLSTRLSRLLRVFSVNMESLPQQANCRQTQPISTDSHTHRVALTTIILRDALAALTRIETVLSQCEVRAHSSGHHRVRLHCDRYHSLFPSRNEGEDDPFHYYHLDDLVTRLRLRDVSWLADE